MLDEWLSRWRPGDAGTDDRGVAFRRELGLPTDRPIVMTGHQPVFWHAGILAKYLAAEVIAERIGGCAVWCVPDQDVVEPGRVRRPVRRVGGVPAHGPGLWDVHEHDLLRWADGLGTTPAGARPPGEPIGVAPDGFASIVDLLHAHRGEPTAAKQVWSAHKRVLGARMGTTTDASTIFATELGATTLFGRLHEMMRDDPVSCAAAYNAAVSAHPVAGVRELVCGERVELPLWHLSRGEPRRVVYADELRDAAPGALAPRGLLFTGMLRAAGCELFLHGTGGGEYDKVTACWFGEWIGEPLAPAGVVSATARLGLGVPEVDKTDLLGAIWRAHHARHSPGMLGDNRADAEKSAMIRRIRTAARGERRALFDELHGLLGRVRTERAEEIAALDREVETIRAALADARIARDREWPWMLHADETLGALRAEIRRRLLCGAGERIT